VLGLIGAVLLVFGMLRPGAPSQTSEAAFLSPGGISALPSFFPAIPFLTDQVVPAMIPASPPGNQALISVWAEPIAVVFPDTGAIFDADCNIKAAGVWDGLGSVCFKVQASFPTAGATAARFAASGSDRLLCDESAFCDLEPVIGDGTMSVLLNGGGKDEMLTVTATDESGNTRTVSVITVQTMIAVPPIVEPDTTPLVGFPPGFSIIGYRCSDVGKSVLMLGGLWIPTTLGDMYDVIYVGALDIGAVGPFYGCGQDTPGNPSDDLVQLQTDVGQMTMQPLLIFPSLALAGSDCPIGKSVSVNDGSLWSWPVPPGPPFQMQNCDMDAAPNGTVGYLAMRTADVGQATVTGQQGSVASSTRQTYVNFIGEPAAGIVPTIMLKGVQLRLAEPGEVFPPTVEVLLIGGGTFVVELVDLPASVSPLSTQRVAAVVLNQSLNPLAGKTVTCTVDPVSGAFALVSDRDTTGQSGIALMELTPTGIPGTEVTLSCSLDGYPNIPPATHTFTFSLTPELETVDLVEGCNPIAATWADGTAIAAVAGAVAPPEALDAIWKFDAASATWQGYSPSVPADVNNLALVDRLDAIFICVNAAATVARPVI
jgi:hypothetical protein